MDYYCRIFKDLNFNIYKLSNVLVICIKLIVELYCVLIYYNIIQIQIGLMGKF